MTEKFPEEAKGLPPARPRSVGRLGRRQPGRGPQGLRLCRRGRLVERQRPGGLHGPRRARSAQADARSPSSKSPPGVHSHKLRVVDDDILYVNSERLGGDAGPQRPHRPVHLRHQPRAGEPKQVGFYDTPGTGPHRFGVDNKRKLAFLPNDAPGWNKRVIWTLDITRSAEARGGQHLGPAVAEGRTARASGGDPMPADDHLHAARSAGHPRQPHVSPPSGAAASRSSTAPTSRNMKLVGHLSWSPPFPGSNHTCWPIGDKPY